MSVIEETLSRIAPPDATSRTACAARIEALAEPDGIAISDDAGSIAFPRDTVTARGGWADAAERVREALRQDEVELLVVGLPLRLDGTEGEAARRARGLGEALADALDVEVTYWDERLTTQQAQGVGKDAAIDEKAAAILLQSYLDAGTPDADDPPGLLEADSGKNTG